MPRKPTLKTIKTVVVIHGKPISVSLYPPKHPRTSWYAYWTGLPAARSTGQSTAEEAREAVLGMLQNQGRLADARDVILTDDEFEEIQRRHYGKRRDPEAIRRAEGSLTACLEAISAFREITGLKPVTQATAADCERFQQKALTLPKNWRAKYPRSREEIDSLSPNTVFKWSVALQAAFERANRNAPGRKCVRGVVPEEKLLTDNPWHKFQWIEGRKKKIRQFNGEELLSLLDWFGSTWKGVTFAVVLAKVFLWSWGRKREVMGLRWDDLRVVGDEYHFESVGKWGIDKWFRVPEHVYQDLLEIRTDSPFVFAAYNEQLRQFHQQGKRPWLAQKVHGEFNPGNLGDWFYNRIAEWSQSLPGGGASIHVFRKTALQYARSGEDVNRLVASDARVSENVMMTNYVKETDDEMRRKSNRTFQRIIASLPPDVAEGYGYVERAKSLLQLNLETALADQNWDLAARLIAELARKSSAAS
jgi:integrase